MSDKLWRGCLAPLEVETGDGRILDAQVSIVLDRDHAPLIHARLTVGEVHEVTVDQGKLMAVGELYTIPVLAPSDPAFAARMFAGELRPEMQLVDPDVEYTGADRVIMRITAARLSAVVAGTAPAWPDGQTWFEPYEGVDLGKTLDGFGGLLRCEQCGATAPINGGDAGGYLTSGWPRCCGHTMRWWTQRQIDAGELVDEAAPHAGRNSR